MAKLTDKTIAPGVKNWTKIFNNGYYPIVHCAFCGRVIPKSEHQTTSGGHPKTGERYESPYYHFPDLPLCSNCRELSSKDPLRYSLLKSSFCDRNKICSQCFHPKFFHQAITSINCDNVAYNTHQLFCMYVWGNGEKKPCGCTHITSN